MRPTAPLCTPLAAAALAVLAMLAMPSPPLGAEEPPQFTEAFMQDPANFELGQAIWKQRCTLCHGRRAYPGKAPKLKPRRYDAQFVYDRVTDGFRAMPAWKHEFNQHERMAVTAYVMHRRFSP